MVWRKQAGQKKTADAVKADYIEVRCEESEKRAFRAAAEAAGLPLSGWIRRPTPRGRKELQDLDKPVAFLDRLSA